LKPKVIREAKLTYSQPPQSPLLAPISFRPQVAVVAEPVQRRGVLSRIPLLRKLKKKPQAFVPPRPLHRERPPLGGLDQGDLTRSVPVDVKVYVNESGKVQSTRLVSELNPADEPLASAALSAAERWDFVPARLEGQKVPGEVILHFRFEPNPR
jgi:TonB family protein